MIDLFGWSEALQAAFAPHAAQGFVPARVLAQHRGLWRVITAEGERTARLSGRFAGDAAPGEHPAVGDRLAVSNDGSPDEVIVHGAHPAPQRFSRNAVSGGGVQVIAANVDVALLVRGIECGSQPATAGAISGGGA